MLSSLAEEAAVQLGERGRARARWRRCCFVATGRRARLAVETAAPTRDVLLIMRLFAERIETLNDPLDPGFGYDQIMLTIARCRAIAGRPARF